MEIPYRASLTEVVDSTLPTLPETRLFTRISASLNRPAFRTCPLLVLAAAYLFPLTQLLRPPFGDEGTLLYGAQRVSEGGIPGRDFVEMIGQGSFYWLGLFFKLFGTGWQVSRLHLLFTGV